MGLWAWWRLRHDGRPGKDCSGCLCRSLGGGDGRSTYWKPEFPPFPYTRSLELGKEYVYCRCGLTKTDPWCDESCKCVANLPADRGPLKFTCDRWKYKHAI